MLTILRIWSLVSPYLGEVLSLLTGINWAWRKVAWIIGIIALLFSGYSLYNKGYQSCKIEVEKQANEKIKSKDKVRNSAVDRNVILDKLQSSKF